MTCLTIVVNVFTFIVGEHNIQSIIIIVSNYSITAEIVVT